MLTITTPADDLQLLDEEQLRLAAGLAVDDTSQDEVLELLGLRVAAEIATACNVSIGSGAEPTLRRELLTETFRGPRLRQLILARRHDVAIISVAADGATLDDTDYEVESESGLLYRIATDRRTWWGCRAITVVYEAGFETVPADLVGVAMDLVRVRRSEAARDPLVKGESIEVPDVLTERTDYWVGAVPGAAAAGMPTELVARLKRYRNLATLG